MLQHDDLINKITKRSDRLQLYLNYDNTKVCIGHAFSTQHCLELYLKRARAPSERIPQLLEKAGCLRDIGKRIQQVGGIPRFFSGGFDPAES